MENVEEVLEKHLDFSRNEAKVYTALLQLGSVPVGEIASVSKVHRTNVYDALERLIEKGLAAYHMENGDVKHYQATAPENLFLILDEKRSQLKNIMPRLHFSSRATKSNVHVYESKTSLRNILNNFLKKNSPIDVFGVPKEIPDYLKHFLENFHLRRTNKQIPMRHIYNTDAADRVKHLNSMQFTEARMLPKTYDSPVSTLICGDEVVLTFFADNIIIIQIENAMVAESYMKYFDLMWNLANK